jgi:hypothetical protein
MAPQADSPSTRRLRMWALCEQNHRAELSGERDCTMRVNLLKLFVKASSFAPRIPILISTRPNCYDINKQCVTNPATSLHHYSLSHFRVTAEKVAFAAESICRESRSTRFSYIYRRRGKCFFLVCAQKCNRHVVYCTSKIHTLSEPT